MNDKFSVFAELFEENEIQYRTKTIVKYGDSWDLIGTIVMKNPGSAYPDKKITSEDFNGIKNNIYPDINIDNWHEFKADNTIRRISKIFDGTFLNKQTKLNGIILVYNLFNVIEKDIVSAVKKANTSISEHLLPNAVEVIKFSRNKPIYLGFYWEYTNRKNCHKQKIEKFANDLFDYIKQSENMYLDDGIKENYFYHPLSLYIEDQKYRHILEKFYDNLFSCPK